MSESDEVEDGPVEESRSPIELLARALVSSIGKDDAKEILSEAAERATGERLNKKPPREAYNIQFANGLSGSELSNILQYELLRARASGTEVTLPVSIVHDIKFRLSWYRKRHGEVERPPPKKVGTRR